MSFTELVNAPAWNDYTIYAESVPHLLHWDITFLHVLEKDAQNRPQGWQQQLDTWRKLIAALLLGKVDIRKQQITGQFLEFAGMLDIHSIDVLYLDCGQGQQPIGVMSPTVLVRPLPTLSSKQLEQIPDFSTSAATNPSYGSFCVLLRDLNVKLSASDNLIARRLAKIVLREFKRELEDQALLGGNIQERTIDVVFLTAIDDSIYLLGKPSPDHQFLSHLTINCFSGYQPLKWVPRCICGAGAPLTQREPVTLQLHQLEISLVCPACHQERPFPLERFMMFWEGDKLYVWAEREEEFTTAVGQLPPRAEISDQTIVLNWGAIQVGHGYPSRIEFRCPGAEVKPVSIRQALYPKLIVPGELTSFANPRFTPTPVRRSAWRWMTATPTCRVDGERITFVGLKLKGIPVSYEKSYLQLQREALGVGVFPKRMQQEWKKYRFFQVPGRAGLRMGVKDAQAVQGCSWLDVNTGWPDMVALEDENTDAGTSWSLGQSPAAAQGSAPCYLGLDFGTTNSIVYYKPAKDGDPQPLKPCTFIGESERIAGSDFRVAPFLPAADYKASTDDDAVIPSAIWEDRDRRLMTIRWGATPPVEQMCAAGAFKWEPTEDKLPGLQRKAFIEELLFLATAAVAARHFSQQPVVWHIGVSYPLAFSDGQRRVYKALYEEAMKALSLYAPATQAHQLFSVNESYACVRAFGAANPNEVYLTADLGGGSLDVALFTKLAARRGEDNVKYHQIGSLAIGGETYVRRVAQRLAGGNESAQYWTVRDAIARSSVGSTFTLQDFSELAEEFLPMPLEFVRTMLAAFALEQQTTTVKVLLVGNGWRIQQFAGHEVAPWATAHNRLHKYLETFSIPGATGYVSSEIENTKHLVALGAMENACFDGRRELHSVPKESKLPAGRGFKLRADADREAQVPWHQVVGPGAEHPIDMMGRVAGQLAVDFLREDAPPVPPSWRNRLEIALPKVSSYPTDEILRQLFLIGLMDDRAAKGPLQIILERTAARLGEQHAAGQGA